MLVRLRAGAFVRVDHEQEEVDACCAGDHRPHEAFVSGDVDEREAPAVGKFERRIAEVDGDPALLFLGEPIRVLAGEGTDEPRLAVVDVARCSDCQRHVRIPSATSATSASVSVRQSSSSLPSRTTPITGGSAARSGAASSSSTAQA